jgi:TetR/AcrR family transcriptional regulator, upper aerobic nicotinate degradation pathway regulator
MAKAAAARSANREPGHRARRAAGDRATDILAVALDLFARRDFASVTVRDIARACGINIALIYYYFGSKEELFRASIEHAIQQAVGGYRRLRTKQTNPVAALEDWFNINIELFDTLRQMSKVTIDYYFSTKSVASIDRLIDKLYEDERQLLAENIRDGVAQGLFRAVDPEATARFVSTHLDGLFFATMNRKRNDIVTNMEDMRRLLWDYLGAKQPPRRGDPAER